MSMNRFFSLCTPDEIFALSRIDEAWRDFEESVQKLAEMESAVAVHQKDKKKNPMYRDAFKRKEMLDSRFKRLQHEFTEQFPDRQLILQSYLESKQAA